MSLRFWERSAHAHVMYQWHVVDAPVPRSPHMLATDSTIQVAAAKRVVLDHFGDDIMTAPPLPLGAGGVIRPFDVEDSFISNAMSIERCTFSLMSLP
eukprot:5738791-Amphidinium_carterae.1